MDEMSRAIVTEIDQEILNRIREDPGILEEIRDQENRRTGVTGPVGVRGWAPVVGFREGTMPESPLCPGEISQSLEDEFFSRNPPGEQHA